MSDLKCPKCGGTSGYYVNKCMSIEQQYNWDNYPLHYVDKNTWGGKVKYCLNCGREVKEVKK